MNDGKTYWKCSSQGGCKARLCLINDVYKSDSGFHNHEPDTVAIEAKKFQAKLKKRAQDDLTTAIPKIYREEIAEAATSVESALMLPSFDNISKVMYRARSTLRPPLPKLISQLKLDGVWREAKSGENFLLADDGEGTNRILIFCTIESLQKLSMCNMIFLDGTFKIVPKMFLQLYTIHGMYMGQLFPYVYCLLQTKNQLTYTRVFELLKTKAVENNLVFNPQSALIDFEASAFNALMEAFPNVNIKGCFFHYAQCIWRKIQQLGLTHLYKSNEEVRKWVRRAVALPLVPEDQIPTAFLWLRENAPHLPQTDLFHTYLLETWLDEVNPLFSRNTWNHFTSDGQRTNNHVEGWHSRLNKKASSQHLSIYAFIDLIKQEQAENEAMMRMLVCGSSLPPKQKLKYRKINEKLSMFKNRLINHEVTLYQYIDMAGYLIRLEG